MSTRYISPLLPPETTTTVPGICPDRPQRSQQLLQFRAISAAQPDGVVRPLPGGKQLESELTELARGWQVDRADSRCLGSHVPRS
jgi:hypothetical protein